MAVVKGDNNFKAIEHNEERMTLVKAGRDTIYFIGGYVPPEPYDKRLEWDYRNKNVSSLNELRLYGYTYKKEVLGYPDRLYTLGIEDGGLSFDVPMNEQYGGSGMLGIPAYDNEFNKGFTSLPKKVCFSFGITPGGRYEEAPSGKYIILDYKLFDPQNGGSSASNLIGLRLTKYTGSNNFSLELSHLIASKGSSTMLIDESNINNKSGYFNVYVEIDYVNSLATVKIGGDETHLDGDDSDTYPNGRYWYVYTHTFSEREKTAIATGLNAKVGTFNNFNHTISVSSNVDVSLTKKWYFRYFKQRVEYRTNYTVRFLNYDNTVLQTGSCAEGTIPTYSGATPTKPPIDEDHFFTFDGWSPDLSPVTQDTDYIAQYKANYLVRFLNYDDTVLQSGSVAEGETPTYSGATPTKPSDTQYSYTFSGWSPAITVVSGDQTYTAQYTATPIVTPTIEGDYDFTNYNMTMEEITALFTVTGAGGKTLSANGVTCSTGGSSAYVKMTPKGFKTSAGTGIESIEIRADMRSSIGNAWNIFELHANNYKVIQFYPTSYGGDVSLAPSQDFNSDTATLGNTTTPRSCYSMHIKIDSTGVLCECSDSDGTKVASFTYPASTGQAILSILSSSGIGGTYIQPNYSGCYVSKYKYKITLSS